jgi:hypothetical protein
MRSNYGMTRSRWIQRVFLTMAIPLSWILVPSESIEGQPDLACGSAILDFRKLKSTSSHADSLSAINNMIACQDTNDLNAYKRRHEPLGPEGARLISMYFDIPEYHDEGRLLGDTDSGGRLLGPVSAIFASPFLGGTSHPWEIVEDGFPGTLAAIVVVDHGPHEQLPTTYKNLNLHFGVNCIWLYLPPLQNGAAYGGDVTTLPLSVYVSHAGNPARCRQEWMGKMVVPPLSGGLADGPLPVVAVKDLRFTGDADYPAVARFDTDKSGEPILAFKCLDAFCEVFPKSVTAGQSRGEVRTPAGLTSVSATTPSWTVPSGMASLTREEVRNRVIKGWHDEQELGVRDTKLKWRPSGVTATVVPNPAAANLDSAAFNGSWQPVATVTFHGAPPTGSSYEKWGFTNGVNVLNLGFFGTWKAKLVKPDGSSREWTHVTRTRHFDVAVPATARFRWTGIDEGLWTPCGRACCHSDGG